jgi:hypothetical protein
MKSKIATTTKPDRAKGKITLKNAPIGEHPSTSAASASSDGKVRKKPWRTNIVNGRFVAIYTAIRPCRVLSNPRSFIRKKRGIMPINEGMNIPATNRL